MKSFGLRLLQFVPVLFLIAVLAFGGYYYTKYQNAQKEIRAIKTNSTVKPVAADPQKLIEKIGKLIELPKETPTIALVTDATKLSNQQFFINAKNGDEILIYPIAKKAILYSESLNRIIDVAPLNMGTPSAETSATKSAVKY